MLLLVLCHDNRGCHSKNGTKSNLKSKMNEKKRSNCHELLLKQQFEKSTQCFGDCCGPLQFALTGIQCKLGCFKILTASGTLLFPCTATVELFVMK